MGQEQIVWSFQANEKTQRAETLYRKDLKKQPPSHHFRRDFLAYCKCIGVVPHPKLLPRLQDDDEEPSSRSSPNYDFADIDEINVKHWKIDEGNFIAMCEALKRCSKIRSICLFDVDLSFKQLEIFCSLIPSTSVEVLQLEWNPTIGKCQTDDEKNHDVTPVYARLIEGDSPLVSLSLRCNGITCAGAKALAKALRQNKKLERLNLFQNEIRDEGALEIAYSLPWNSALKHLSLANNLLSGIAARLVVQTLTRYPAPPSLLKELENAEPAIAAEIEQAKKAKKKLDRNVVIQALGLPLLETIKGTPHAPGNNYLQVLVLSGNEVEEDDVKHISDELDLYKKKLDGHLQQIKLQRIPHLKGIHSRNIKFSSYLQL